jgi:ABC-2 type transport system permease protein
VFVVLYIVAISIMMDIENATSWYYILIALLEVVFISYFGLFLDTVNPKLVWDDELNALRGNFNIFFNMAYAMLIAAVFVVLLLGLYLFTKIPLRALQMELVFVLLVADCFMIRECIVKGEGNLRELD